MYHNLLCLHWQYDVLQWLDTIKLSQYKALFKSEGYSTGEDVENLKGLKRKDLEEIGITRRGK